MRFSDDVERKLQAWNFEECNDCERTFNNIRPTPAALLGSEALEDRMTGEVGAWGILILHSPSLPSREAASCHRQLIDADILIYYYMLNDGSRRYWQIEA